MAKNDDGFTLLETLVALIVLALAGAAAYAVLSGATRTIRTVDSEAEAVILAQSLIAGAGINTPLQPGVQNGIAHHGMAWTVETKPRPGPGDDKPTAYFVTATVRWVPSQGIREREVSLQTIKLIRASP